MLYGCPFEKIYFLTRIGTNPGIERDVVEKVSLLNFFDNVSQSLANPGFVSILFKK